MTTLDPADLIFWLTNNEDPKATPPLSPEELMAAAAQVISAQQARINQAIGYVQYGDEPEYGNFDPETLLSLLTGEGQPADAAAQPCGDYPAPCNCDDPATHSGRKIDFPSWLTRRDAADLTPEELDYVNSAEFARDGAL